MVEERRGHFKAKSANSWSTIKESEPSYAPTPSPEPEDESPVIVPTLAIPAARGGLQSSADLRAENDRREAERAVKKAQAERELKKRKKEMRDRGEDEEDAQETVYRDSQGRKIDVKLEKAEKAKQERAKMEAEMKKMEWGKGEVQKEDKEKKRQELAEMKYKPIARYADDEAMNNEMKDQNRWNDPAAGFLTVSFIVKFLHDDMNADHIDLLQAKKVTKANAPKYPKYAGPPPPPNRFGIPPGYRWDGVIRGNGFESTMMQRGNSVKMRAAEAHAYNTEEM